MKLRGPGTGNRVAKMFRDAGTFTGAYSAILLQPPTGILVYYNGAGLLVYSVCPSVLPAASAANEVDNYD